MAGSNGTAKLRGIARGKFNVAVGFLGVPGTGKSTSALAYARQYEGHCYIIAHDPTYSYEGPDVQRHETLQDLSESLRTRPGGIHALDLEEGSEVVQAAIRIAHESVGTKNETPVLLMVDEAVACDQMGAYRLGTSFRRLVTNRRHLHIGIVWTSQNPGYVHHTILAQMTQLVIFRLTDERSLKRLEQAGVPPDILKKVPSLPEYQYVVWDFQKPRHPDALNPKRDTPKDDLEPAEPPKKPSGPTSQLSASTGDVPSGSAKREPSRHDGRGLSVPSS